MGIKIIPEPDVYITEEEHHRLRRDYEAFCSYCVNPPSFEGFVRSRKRSWDEVITEGKKHLAKATASEGAG